MKKNGFYIISFLLLITTTTKGYTQLVGGGSQTNGSSSNNLVSAVPFLLITPDARTGAMGNAGVAVAGDVNSSGSNPAKLSFLEEKYGVGISYSPWLKNIANDINLSYLSGYYKIDERNTIAASLRYFSLGDVQLTDLNQQIIGVANPNEFAADITYSRKFGENFALGTSLRYISSNVMNGINGNGSGNNDAVAADIAALYTSKTILFGKSAILSSGINISNIGSKMSEFKNGPQYFLPSNLKLGGAATILIDDFNDITWALDFNKLLIPTQPVYDSNGNIVQGRNPNQSVTSALFNSFSDAPGGFSEELKEIGISTGLEYWYNMKFALRAGYNYQHADKGNSKYFTFGAGLRYNRFDIDLAFIAADAKKSPLANTLRFGLMYQFAN